MINLKKGNITGRKLAFGEAITRCNKMLLFDVASNLTDFKYVVPKEEHSRLPLSEPIYLYSSESSSVSGGPL